MAEKVHHGRAVKRIREMMHVKQDVLAMELNIAQQTVSTLEAKETIDPETLEQLAKILGVPAEAIRNFKEEAVVNITSNTFTDFKDNASGINNNCNLSFNPTDKWLEALEENKKLYERLLQTEREKVALLEKILVEKKN